MDFDFVPEWSHCSGNRHNVKACGVKPVKSLLRPLLTNSASLCRKVSSNRSFAGYSRRRQAVRTASDGSSNFVAVSLCPAPVRATIRDMSNRSSREIYQKNVGVSLVGPCFTAAIPRHNRFSSRGGNRHDPEIETLKRLEGVPAATGFRTWRPKRSAQSSSTGSTVSLKWDWGHAGWRIGSPCRLGKFVRRLSKIGRPLQLRQKVGA